MHYVFYYNLKCLNLQVLCLKIHKLKKPIFRHSGLFHDIANPTFKHCIDFMNGDYEHQESTEERTLTIIQNSEKIMKLLGS